MNIDLGAEDSWPTKLRKLESPHFYKLQAVINSPTSWDPRAITIAMIDKKAKRAFHPIREPDHA
jgi:hypothetical protein